MFKKFNKAVTLALSLICSAVLAVSCAIFTSADTSGERTVAVTGEGQAVDSVTLAGTSVNAYYGFSGRYNCAEFVIRFYSQVFGETVTNLYSRVSTPVGSKAGFTATTKPSVGDIVRFSDRTHWAIVKSVKGDKVTIAEQNWSYYSGGRLVCTVGRTITVGPSYTFFHYNDYDNAVEKAVRKVIDKRLTDVEDNEKLQQLKTNSKQQLAMEKKFSSYSIIFNTLEQ